MKTKNIATLCDIQRFSVHDGPGIRTSIFFKSCPLRCAWCHNPESLIKVKEYIYYSNKCVGCRACEKVCNYDVHSFENGIHKVEYDKCVKCRECLSVCCYGAIDIIGREVSVDDIIEELQPDIPYYENDGGVTLSGGEPMLQSDFLIELCKRLKKNEINICMETCGYARPEEYKEIAPYIDMFLYDYKITDPDEHKKWTGVSNELIMDNLTLLDYLKKDIVLRCPIIPGINDTDLHFRAIANISAKSEMIKRVDILPYHTMGESKRIQIGIEKSLPEVNAASEEQKKEWIKRLKNFGCEAYIE